MFHEDLWQKYKFGFVFLNHLLYMFIEDLRNLDFLVLFFGFFISIMTEQDSFTRCFKSNPPEPWNWNVYLFPLWCFGVVVRYFILFPGRLALLLLPLPLKDGAG
jgi:hypothetical protein